ncbi:MAG TPA: hypothetical protein VLZ10_01250 [Thermodesulfobacteriota bacterium]|nr:hypothetical protein [Thermodesulfobacteriota bacterium]
MNQRVLRSLLTTLFILLSFSNPLQATGKPDITRHEAQSLGGALNMQIEWQSPNPVVLIRISIGNLQKEIKVDAYDNKRNRDGYAGEVNFTLNLEGAPSEPFPYVLQLEDELRIKSPLVRGKVKVASSQPGVVFQSQQPSMQIQIQQNVPQFGIQSGIQPSDLPAVVAGVLSGSSSLPVGSLIVIISPLIAAESGAMWRVGDRPWMRNGEAISGLPVGIHTVEFQDVGGWFKPDYQKVMIEGGQTLTINGFYNNR